MTVIDKHDIRKEALRRRNEIPTEHREEASLIVCRSVMDDERFLEARSVHVYMPVGSELDIKPLIDVAWELGKGVGMMRVHDDGGTAHYSITTSTEFESGALGIPRPVDAERFDMDLCDLVIVPIVAADEQCNRLGYGKGYYDQFLTHYPRPSIGVAYEAQVYPVLPSDELDIRLDSIYTEVRRIGRDGGAMHDPDSE